MGRWEIVALSWLDWALIVVLLLVIVLGFRRGFWISMGTVSGAIAGVLGGLWLMPVIVELVPAGVPRIITMVAVTAFLIWFGMWLGRKIGARLRLHISHPVLRLIDKFLGAIGNAIVTTVLIAVIAFSIASVGVPGITSTLKNSRIVSVATDLTPERARAWVAQVRADVLDSSELPELDLAGDGTTVEDEQHIEPTRDVEETSISSVRITGSAYECGQSQTGSGFAVAGDRVVTNAHVVAGVQSPQVESFEGQLFTGQVVAFDPEIDVAIIALPGAQLPVVEFGDVLEPGEYAFVLGYPSGGPHQIEGAQVQARGPATVENIYNENPQLRDVYQVAADVRQGNSGGALVDEQGLVVGVIFARAAEAEIGYALSNAEISDLVGQAPSLSEPVSTGSCLE
ncbi:MarP family serine protease [Enteractinococcus fodinae]|uniref:S1-C subfamily serine protease n=1 Tax=Enteractinococcus fodinae TaxID=684663 RepID=A0ABU2AY67_9MICC|nr:MarP family serine protease [Enteractinococcus fodinae]MDR7346300.1 S1-C subfamily serine protease [Enteractinococcus fodinae]